MGKFFRLTIWINILLIICCLIGMTLSYRVFGSGNWYCETINIDVDQSIYFKDTRLVQITVSGLWSTPCYEITSYEHTISGNTIFITATIIDSPGFCIQIISDWSFTENIGQLPSGSYTVVATINSCVFTQNIEIQPVMCPGDIDENGDLDIFDLIYVNRYLQGFPSIVPSIRRITNSNIPSDEVIKDSIERCYDYFDVNQDDNVDIIDLVIISRYLHGFQFIVPISWRLANPNFPPDDEIAIAVEALKPPGTTSDVATNIKLDIYSDG
ncbi:MAG: hypothetical protein ACMUIU_08265 [bacterium]